MAGSRWQLCSSTAIIVYRFTNSAESRARFPEQAAGLIMSGGKLSRLIDNRTSFLVCRHSTQRDPPQRRQQRLFKLNPPMPIVRPRANTKPNLEVQMATFIRENAHHQTDASVSTTHHDQPWNRHLGPGPFHSNSQLPLDTCRESRLEVRMINMRLPRGTSDGRPKRSTEITKRRTLNV